MSPISLVTTVMVTMMLVLPHSSLAQNWTDYTSKTDFFHVNFPGEPKVKDITYTTQYGITLPGRVYSVENAPSRYSITVVDYADTEKLHTAQADQCKKNGGEGDACMNDWRGDVQGSIVYASWQFLQRNAKVTHYEWAVVDSVEGHHLQLINPDQSRTFAAIHRHGTRLYILEATVPKGAPAPGLFQQSLMFVDKDGNSIRYRSYYTTGYSEDWHFPSAPPARAR